MPLVVYRMHDRSVTANARAHNYDLYGDRKIMQRFGSYLDPRERKQVYFREAHASAHRTVHALANRQLKCAATAVILGVEFSWLYARDTIRAFYRETVTQLRAVWRRQFRRYSRN